MAWASGTATDFIDMLRLFRDYAAGLVDPAVHPTITAGVAVTTATATGTLTFTGQPANGETVSIGGKTYTYQTTLTNFDGNVHIGGSTAASITNLIEAINLGAGSGTDYAASMTDNLLASAAAGAGTTITVSAESGGAYGNSIATTETIANASFGAATLTGGVGWYILPNGAGMTALPGSGFATDGECYLAGPGSDPTDKIIVGFQTYRNAGANIFGWGVRGFTGWNPALTFTTLPGTSPTEHAAFDDASIACFFWVNDRRLMAVGRIGTTDILVHAGFIQQLGTRGQYPYPLLVSGSVSGLTQSFQTNLFSQSSLPDPCASSAHLRWVDGTWLAFENYQGASADRATARGSSLSGSIKVIWPSRDPTIPAETSAYSNQNENTIFESFATSTAPYVSSSEIGGYGIYPSVLIAGTGLAAPDDYTAIGRIDGLMTCFGLGLNSGDTLTIGGDTYDVFKNTWRSEPVDMYAILRA